MSEAPGGGGGVGCRRQGQEHDGQQEGEAEEPRSGSPPEGATQSHPDDRGGPVPERHAGPGLAAAGAQAAAFPIHFGRHPTPVRTAAYASGTTLGDVIPERFRPLVEATADLADRFATAGHSHLPGGGSVRDAIVAEPEVAVATASRPRLHHRRPTRRDRGGGVGLGRRRVDPGQAVRHHRRSRGDQKYEITTHRAEAYRPESRKPEVAFGDSVEDDLARRDFTVNAMALRLPDLELIDPFDGLVDLSAHRLRTPLDPEVSFADDPLRMLRAARFIARLELEPDPEPGRGGAGRAPSTGHRLGRADPRRARQDADGRRCPRSGCGSWSTPAWPHEFLPELPGLALEQDPIHRHKDVLAHTLAVVDKTSPDRLLRLAALFHDIGKPETRAFVDGGVTFHHHEVVGARMTRHRMQRPAVPERRASTMVTAWSSCTCGSTPTAWGGPTGPCAATSATPATSSTGSTS